MKLIQKDIVKSINNRCYLNNVALKCRYDALESNKYNLENKHEIYSHWYKDRPYPILDHDLRLNGKRLENKSLDYVGKRNQEIVASMFRSNIFEKLNMNNHSNELNKKMIQVKNINVHRNDSPRIDNKLNKSDETDINFFINKMRYQKKLLNKTTDLIPLKCKVIYDIKPSIITNNKKDKILLPGITYSNGFEDYCSNNDIIDFNKADTLYNSKNVTYNKTYNHTQISTQTPTESLQFNKRKMDTTLNEHNNDSLNFNKKKMDNTLNDLVDGISKNIFDNNNNIRNEPWKNKKKGMSKNLIYDLKCVLPENFSKFNLKKKVMKSKIENLTTEKSFPKNINNNVKENSKNPNNGEDEDNARFTKRIYKKFYRVNLDNKISKTTYNLPFNKNKNNKNNGKLKKNFNVFPEDRRCFNFNFNRNRNELKQSEKKIIVIQNKIGKVYDKIKGKIDEYCNVSNEQDADGYEEIYKFISN